MLTLAAPAKVNLVLEVLGKRPDGYHEVMSVLQTVSLADRLTFEVAEGLEVVWSPGQPPLPLEETSVARAARLLQGATGYSGGARIGVEKAIPPASGLGGHSSDAAATLWGLNRLWGLGLSHEELASLGARLSSDVPFFLYGGIALVEGRGERVTPLPDLVDWWFVLVVPPVAVPERKTERAYRSLPPSAFTRGERCQELVGRLKRGEGLELGLLFNAFDSIAFQLFPGLRNYAEEFRRLGAGLVLLAGSGPALFAPFPDRERAALLGRRAKEAGMESYVVEAEPAHH